MLGEPLMPLKRSMEPLGGGEIASLQLALVLLTLRHSFLDVPMSIIPRFWRGVLGMGALLPLVFLILLPPFEPVPIQRMLSFTLSDHP